MLRLVAAAIVAALLLLLLLMMLLLVQQVFLQGQYKLLLGQGHMSDSGEKTPGKDGWHYPNGSWVTAADVGWKCGLAYKPGAAYDPCLFAEEDLREPSMHDSAFRIPTFCASACMYAPFNLLA